jgi:chemotaxis protein MotB
MSRSKLFLAMALILAISLSFGCNGQVKLQNQRQQATISDLSSKLQTTTLEKDQLQRKVNSASDDCKVQTEELQQKIAALEKDTAQKKALLESVGKGLTLGAPLPADIATKLEDLQKSSSGMISFDASKGLVRFQSDLLFDKGSDEVSTAGVAAVKAICAIINTEEGKNYDVIIAGHTDNVPISRAETKAKHPTNWHLSVDRAISVLTIMTGSGVSPERVSARGFGEFRPLEANAAGTGNPKNRRVEIYIVPKGV